jgi:hypothetical protein
MPFLWADTNLNGFYVKINKRTILKSTNHDGLYLKCNSNYVDKLKELNLCMAAHYSFILLSVRNPRVGY